MTATPAAPAARTAGTCRTVMPPIASTGTAAAPTAAASAAGPTAVFPGVAYTAPKKAKSAPIRARSSFAACVDTPIRPSGPTRLRATATGTEVPPRWTPSAPTASATSIRSFTKRSAPVRAVALRSCSAISRSRRPGRSFSRSWTAGSPASSAVVTTATSSRPSVAWRSVTRTREGTAVTCAGARLSDDAFERARRGRIELRRDAPGEERLPPCLDSLPHRLGHQDRVPGARDGGVHEHGVAAELERLGGMRRRADAGVDDHRHPALLDDDAEVVGVPDAEPRADRRGERHDGGAAEVLEALAGDRVVRDVGQDLEALLQEHARRLDRRRDVGEERPFVADHLELHERPDPRLAGEPAGADRVLRRVAAGGVGEDREAVEGQVI